MGYISLMHLCKLVFDGLASQPDPEFREEINRRISETFSGPGRNHHLAGGVLYWIATNSEGHCGFEEFTAEGRDLIKRFCEAECLDKESYRDLFEARPRTASAVVPIESAARYKVSGNPSPTDKEVEPIKDERATPTIVHSMRTRPIPLLRPEMEIRTCTDYPDDELEEFRPTGLADGWELVVSGFWSESPYHTGYIAYCIRKSAPDVWIMDGVERNAELDGITDEDVKEGRLNDDQIQAMWGMSLEEAQNAEYRRIVAVCFDAPPESSSKEIANVLYDAICEAGGKVVEEPDSVGLLGK